MCELRGGRVVERGEDAGGVVEQVRAGVLHAGLFGAGHRVRADKAGGLAVQGALCRRADQVFRAADIGHQAVGCQCRANLLEQRGDGLHRRAQYDQIAAVDGGLRRGRGGVAPALFEALRARGGAPRPADHALGQAALLHRHRE